MEFKFDPDHEFYFRGEKIIVKSLTYDGGNPFSYRLQPKMQLSYYLDRRNDFDYYPMPECTITDFPLEWLECRPIRSYTVGRRD
jgi:hypothetical protein